MSLFDDHLRRLPQSTNAWSCPWFESIAFCLLGAILLGATSGGTMGTVIALLAAGLLTRVVLMRRRNPSC